MKPASGTGERTPALLACLGCIILGCIHILNVHPIGDGVWFWYGVLFRQGHLLYHDLHFNQQPVFVLLTAVNQRMFGLSWLASKIPAALQLVAYVACLYLLSLYAAVRPWVRAVLISAAFFLLIAVTFARFDDYHILTYIVVTLSIYLLLRYHSQEQPKYEWLLTTTLAILGGISLGNRLNDGVSLVAAQSLILPFFLKRYRAAATTLYIVTAPLVLICIVLATGDNLSDWIRESVHNASAIKGGTGNLLLGPLLYPFRQVGAFFGDRFHFALPIYILLLVSVLAYIIRSRDTAGGWRSRQVVYGSLVLIFFLAAASPWLRQNMISLMTGSMCMVGAMVLMAFLLRNLVRQWKLHGISAVNPLPLLLLLPLLQVMLGAAITASKADPETTPVAGELLLLLPISLPAVASGLPEAVLASVALLVTGYSIPMKAATPYQWQDYFDRPAFTAREWYSHPLYGPMYIETSQEKLAGQICARIHGAGTTPELLSIPFPYPNYYCGITPWHGYVQTWYDTSSASAIGELTRQLEQGPPEWIVYQRNLTIVAAHEFVYRHNRLPHRSLDDLVVNRLATGSWTIALQQCHDRSDWVLIHTRPVQQGQYVESLLPSTDTVNLCSRTGHDLRLP